MDPDQTTPTPTLPSTEPAPPPDPEIREGGPEITFDEWCRIDIRLGTVQSAERVPKSDKLLCLQVSFGPMGTRQILAGIGKSFQPQEVVGQQLAFVVNLAPRKMMGLVSHGMLLATGEATSLSLIWPWGASAMDGSRLG